MKDDNVESGMINKLKAVMNSRTDCCNHGHGSQENEDEVPLMAHKTHDQCCAPHDHVEKTASNADDHNSADENVTTTRLKVQGICCSREAELVKSALEPVEGVKSVSVNVVARIAVVRHNQKVLSPNELVKILNDFHLGVSILESGAANVSSKSFAKTHSGSLGIILVILSLFSVVLFADLYREKWGIWVSISLMAIGCLPIIHKAFSSWRRGVFLDVNVLMLIAVIGVAALGQWLEGAALVTVFYMADVVQNYCFYLVEKAVSKLAVQTQPKAICAKTREELDVDCVELGTSLAICEGESMPLDGIVRTGSGAVDESLITGEATPITKSEGDIVYSGTILQTGYLEIETTSTTKDSTIAQISKMVQESQEDAGETHLMINRLAKFYTPMIFTLAVAVFALPVIIDLSKHGHVQSKSLELWSTRALMVLLIACPCALLMCIPIPVVSGIVSAAKNGILVKGGATMEAMASVKTVLFDKTGTLTEGKLHVNDVETYSEDLKSKEAMEEFMRTIAALEKKSNHPAATALVNFFFGCLAEYHARDAAIPMPEVSRFESLGGLGIRGTVEGREVLIGNLALMETAAVPWGKSNQKVLEWTVKGISVVFVAVEGELQMVIGLSDKPRSTAATGVQALKSQSIEVCIVTGDGKGPAEFIARLVGIEEVFPNMKPADKLQVIRDKKGKQKNAKDTLAMVGDGINDVPSLSSADVGIAVATSGMAITLESADVILINDNISKIASLFQFSKHVRSICIQNIVLAIATKVVTMVIIFVASSGLWIAILSDLLALIAVIFNGIRPLIWRDVKKSWK